MLKKLHFECSQADPCLFIRVEKNGNITYVLVYVDDLLVDGYSEKVTMKVDKKLDHLFQMKDLGEVSNYIGMQIDRETDGSFVHHQKLKIAILLENFGLQEPKPAKMHMEVGLLASESVECPRLPDKQRYQQAIGSLLYLATVSRSDIAVAVGILCCKVAAPREQDWKAVKHVMHYLATTIEWGLKFPEGDNLQLLCHADADWAGDQSDRKSTSGYVL